MLPDWQLPPGVDRGLWDYVRNEEMVRSYDDRLAGTPLLDIDQRFAEEVFATPGRLIDLGCGTGRLLLPFARQGFDCVGVDLSEPMLMQVAEKATREGLQIATMQANLVELDGVTEGSFDYAACLFSTLGMIRGRVNRQRFLGHVKRILKPDGKFVLHVHNRQFHLGVGLGRTGSESGDRRMPQSFGGAELTLHHFSQAEIRRDLTETGLSVDELRPVGLSTDGRLSHAWLLPSIRSYGYLIAASPV